MFLDAGRILVPVMGEKVEEEAFQLACDLGKENKGKIFAVHVIEVKRELPVDAEINWATTRGERLLNQMEAIGREKKCNVEAEILQAREAGPAIVREAIDKDIELIILGLPFKRHLGSFTLGETALYVLKSAPCPVILLREQPAKASPAGG